MINQEKAWRGRREGDLREVCEVGEEKIGKGNKGKIVDTLI